MAATASRASRATGVSHFSGIAGGLAWWHGAIALSGAVLFVAGPLHPDPIPGVSFEQAIAGQLVDARWGVAHLLMLASTLSLAAGLFGLLRSRLLTFSPYALAAAVAAMFTTLLATVEMIFHVAAPVDVVALNAGEATPVLTTHIVLAIIAYPAFGFSFAALAVLMARGRGLGHKVLAALGAIGAIVYGVAAPVVIGTREAELAVLFIAATLFALWLIAAPWVFTGVPAAPPRSQA